LAVDGAVESSVGTMLAQDAALRSEVEALKQQLSAEGLTAEAQRERLRQALPPVATSE
jgi:regulator of replication initiation timing